MSQAERLPRLARDGLARLLWRYREVTNPALSKNVSEVVRVMVRLDGTLKELGVPSARNGEDGRCDRGVRQR